MDGTKSRTLHVSNVYMQHGKHTPTHQHLKHDRTRISLLYNPHHLYYIITPISTLYNSPDVYIH